MMPSGVSTRLILPQSPTLAMREAGTRRDRRCKSLAYKAEAVQSEAPDDTGPEGPVHGSPVTRLGPEGPAPASNLLVSTSSLSCHVEEPPAGVWSESLPYLYLLQHL